MIDLGYDAIVVFDTETTGLKPRENRIIELAAIRIDPEGERELDLFIKLPAGQRIPPKIVELTHITDEMLETDGVDERSAAGALADMLSAERTLMVAHNAQFDIGFVGNMFSRQTEAPEMLRKFERADYLDTMTVLKDRRSYPHKLLNAIEYYGLQEEVCNSHRAVDDCRALYAVMQAMCRERSDLAEYVNVFGYNPKYGVNGERVRKISYRAQPFHNEMVPPEQILPRRMG